MPAPAIPGPMSISKNVSFASRDSASGTEVYNLRMLVMLMVQREKKYRREDFQYNNPVACVNVSLDELFLFFSAYPGDGELVQQHLGPQLSVMASAAVKEDPHSSSTVPVHLVFGLLRILPTAVQMVLLPRVASNATNTWRDILLDMDGFTADLLLASWENIPSTTFAELQPIFYSSIFDCFADHSVFMQQLLIKKREEHEYTLYKHLLYTLLNGNMG